ncbi:hypothetical protein ESCO_001734 [Escovopsis weberi]|uniref:Uncharacterized protein n=1 Tax=Escovopsis weberi TaxID=150374 RepID=A0A0M8MZJ2_ESCWE|nr:hypothetical protein ESCO_001734 [Escovopsis weberi]
MFMSFGTAPRILRIYCRATVVEWDQPEFFPLVRKIAKAKRDAFDGARSVILGDIWEVTTSCGYGVPRVKKGLYDEDASDSSPHKSIQEVLHEGPYGGETLTELAVFEERPTLDKSATTKTQSNKMNKYQVANNANSIDGLPGLRTARREAEQRLWLGDAKARLRRIAAEKEAVAKSLGHE